jgi:tight adherence protein C
MTEPIVAAGLIAVAAAAAVVAAATAAGRAPWTAPRLPFPIRGPWWIPPVVAAALPAPLVISLPAAVVGTFVVRRFLVLRAAAARRRATDEEVPQLLDLLAAAASAGLSAMAGFRAAVVTLRGPLGEELRACVDAVDLGGRWRPELARVADRLSLPELRRAVAIVDRTATLGTSLADATRELAADVRQARRAAVAERARAAPVKMLFPLVFLILPAFLLLTVVPVLLTTVRSIR